MRRKLYVFLLGILLLSAFTACSMREKKDSIDKVEEVIGDGAKDDSKDNSEESSDDNNGNSSDGNTSDGNTSNDLIPVEYRYNQDLNIIDDNYRTYYEVFLYSFYDSDGDGIGDINGLISKLDYINDGDDSTDTDLGFNGIWLMPIMPSNTYHKYDVKDYYNIDRQYGSLDDFKRLLEECNKRGIKVIIDLVLNHSSNLHPWFLSAVKSLNYEPCGKKVCIHENLCREHNPYVNYYNFVQGKPSESYYHTTVDDWYYEAVFTSNMPDLNLDDKNLRKEIEDIMAFWLDMGVGGFRLDAALHYFDQDTDKNNEVLAWLNDFIKSKNESNYMVAEIWTNFSKYARYYESGIDSVFNFAFATETGIIVKTLNYKGAENSAKAFGEAMLQVINGTKKYNENAIDAPFFTNHDTARASGYFSGNIDKIKMAAGLNLMMTGSTFVYYGEELGMSGAGRDENKRAPMYWSNEEKEGMPNPPANMETVTHNVAALDEQMKDPLSIYHYYKRAIRLRNENPEIGRGMISVINELSDMEVLTISKEYENSKIHMIYNISESVKEVTISKSNYGYEGIRGYLTVGKDAVTLEGETLVLPPYSIAILK